MTCYVYRTYDDDENLLYVGCAVDPDARLKAHSNGAAWWRDVVEINVREYPTRERALAVEARAISLLSPLWNRSGYRPHAQARRQAKADAERMKRLHESMAETEALFAEQEQTKEL